MMGFTRTQQNIIDYKGKTLLVSASAGTGKTTVMIQRIVSLLLREDVDVSSLMVVTFTNLAAGEMKARLSDELSSRRGNAEAKKKLENLDSAKICTLHSFCNDLLRNYFYVVDVDPSFAILDSGMVASLQAAALDELFGEYFDADDEVFQKVYKIFSTNRQEENFRSTLLKLYGRLRCFENFGNWYQGTRQNFLSYSDDNPIAKAIVEDIRFNAIKYAREAEYLAKKCERWNIPTFAALFDNSAKAFREMDLSTLPAALNSLSSAVFVSLPRKGKSVDGCEPSDEQVIREEAKAINGKFNRYKKSVSDLFGGFESLDEVWAKESANLVFLDKIIEILQRFEEKYFLAKKQRGGLDFNDLEHLTLQVLDDAETLEEIRNTYKYVFVDEYQDTNPVQEAIISRIAQNADTFMVGDIKQSIYRFRGCDSTIFLNRYNTLRRQDREKGATEQANNRQVVELNDNFRSNSEILNFVNDVFDCVMTEDFGDVDYRGVKGGAARLSGNVQPQLKTDAVRINLLVESKGEEGEVNDYYDISAKTGEDVSLQGQLIAERIRRYVGMAYKVKVKDFDGEREESRTIDFKDIVILVRSVKGPKTVDIYNSLVAKNIPVVASFKAEGYINKEVRDLITLIRAIDNPYNDVFTVGACLAPYGGFTPDELAQIKIKTGSGETMPFYTRMQQLANENSSLGAKISSLIALFDELRFFSHSATVDEVLLKILEKTNFHLYVQGFPNGELRLRKMYAFIDGMKGATYAQSISGFLNFLDEPDDGRAEEGLSQTNAVRIMTMHASKGLGFPVVFLANMESHFNDRQDTVLLNDEIGIAMKLYNFENMRVDQSVANRACQLLNIKKAHEEEMRLLYVAMTRAKFALEIVGTLTEGDLMCGIKTAEQAKSHLDWVLFAQREKYGQDFISGSAQKVTVVSQVSAEQKTGVSLKCQQYGEGEKSAVLDKLNFVYGFESQRDMPSKIVSSALDKEKLDFEDEHHDAVLVENSDRNFVGTAYHKVYQYLPSYDTTVEQIRQTLEGLVRDGLVLQEYAAKVDCEKIYETLQNPQLRKLMASGRVYHEVPFMLFVPYNKVDESKGFFDEVMLQGIIDLLIVDGDRAVVVDFKYSTRSVEGLKRHYQKQLHSYVLAVKQICGIDNVESYIFSIEQNKLVSMSKQE